MRAELANGTTEETWGGGGGEGDSEGIAIISLYVSFHIFLPFSPKRFYAFTIVSIGDVHFSFLIRALMYSFFFFFGI